MTATRRYRSAAALAIAVCAGATSVYTDQAKPAATQNVQVNRAARDTWTPVMEVLKPARSVTVTDAQLQRLRELPLEAVWGALQSRGTCAASKAAFS